MTGKLTYLTKSLLNEPQLITEHQLTFVAEFLNDRNSLTDLKTAAEIQEKMDIGFGSRSAKAEAQETGVAILNISGALSHKATMFEAMCGGASSYASLTKMYDKLTASKDVHTIVMEIDSGGGEARGAFEFARHLKDSKGDKKLIAHTDSLAASAAYAIAAVADEVIVSSDAEVGSIGVISQLVNREKQLEKVGLEVETIFAGKGKDLGNPTRTMTDDERAYLQGRVDTLYTDFVSHVTDMRGLAQDFIIDSLGASTYRGQDAVDKGLADKVMSNSEFINYLGDLEDGAPLTQSNLETQTTMAKEASEIEVKLQEMKDQMAEVMATNATLVETLAVSEAKELATAKAGLVKLASAWEVFGVDASAFAEVAQAGTVPVEMFESAMAEALSAIEAKNVAVEESAAMEEIGETAEAETVTPEMEAIAATNAAIAARYPTK
jgi:signal peptide peptidase SppA